MSPVADRAEPIPSRRILVVDDSSLIREAAALALGTMRGWDVLTAASGEEGLERAGVDRPDAVLLDVVMPGLDGIALARQVSESQPGIRIMFITGFAGVAMHDDGFASKRPRVMAKPFHLRHLISEIEALLQE